MSDGPGGRSLSVVREMGTPELQALPLDGIGVQVWGFEASGDGAIAWWHRLREVHDVSGYWPILMDAEAPEYFSMDGDPHSSAADRLAQAAELDGATILSARGQERLGIYEPEYSARIGAELRGEGDWRENARQPGFRLPYRWDGTPEHVTLALIPASAGWQVPAVLGYGGWNEYPFPAEHTAILRYWDGRYDAELVAMTGTTAEFRVGTPPTTRSDALSLAWEYHVYNDGQYDLYDADSVTDLAASLLAAPVWLAWWD